MTGVFGEVADAYDDVRPAYPAQVATAILAYHGRVPAHVVEVGAGTGKGTEVLLHVGAPMTCIEPDPRMAAILAAKYPQVAVRTETFEQWVAPTGGVPVIACALAWHWLDATTRNQRAHAALTPGGTLAVFGHKYDYADPAQERALAATFQALDPTAQERAAGWFHADITGSGLFTDVRTEVTSRRLELPAHQYLQLLQTFGPFRTAPQQLQAKGLEVVGALVDGFGGAVVLELRTTLVLARRRH